jgi:hypothetical protein
VDYGLCNLDFAHTGTIKSLVPSHMCYLVCLLAFYSFAFSPLSWAVIMKLPLSGKKFGRDYFFILLSFYLYPFPLIRASYMEYTASYMEFCSVLQASKLACLSLS